MTNLVELACIHNKSSDANARKFEQTWLAQYPRPMHILHDNGCKFTGYSFTSLLCILNIKDIPTTSKNSQSNAICKDMHQTMVIILKTLFLSWSPQIPQDALHLVDDGLVTTMHIMRSDILTTVKSSLGALATPETCSSMFPLLQNGKLFLTILQLFLSNC